MPESAKTMRASLVTLLVKKLLAVEKTLSRFLGGKDPLEKDGLLTPAFLGFLAGSNGKGSTWNAGHPASVPGLGRSPRIGHAAHFSILAWRFPTDRGACWARVHGVTDSQTRLSGQAEHSSTESMNFRSRHTQRGGAHWSVSQASRILEKL